MADYAVSVQNLTKTFRYHRPSISSKLLNYQSSQFSADRLVALEDVSFHVSMGEILGIIGLNGSGKTTLLRTIAGVYLPDSGNITTTGKIAPLIQIGVGFHNELTAPENIIISGMLYGFSKREIEKKIEPIIEFAELQDFFEMPLKHYSAGMKARLSFSLAMQIDPDIILVDEALSVGDISFRKKSFNAFLDFKKRKKTILFATHILNVLPKLCERVLLLDKGRMVVLGNPDEVIQKYRELTNNPKDSSP